MSTNPRLRRSRAKVSGINWMQLKRDADRTFVAWRAGAVAQGHSESGLGRWRKWTLEGVLSDHLDEYLLGFPASAGNATTEPWRWRVLVTLALLAGGGDWPPPESVVRAIFTRLENLPPDSRQDLAAGLAVAYLVGWDRPRLAADGSWKGIVPQAHETLRRYLYGTVWSCIRWLEKNVIGFPKGQDVRKWTQRAINRLTARTAACNCYMRSAGGVEDPKDLTGNAKRKADTCLRQHRLSAWDPAQCTFWEFCRRAVKGTCWEFRPSQFTSGILFDLLLEEFPLRMVNIARHLCLDCGKWTVNTDHCFVCGRRLDPTDTRVRVARHWLILDDAGGGFRSEKVWTCRAPARSLTGLARQTLGPAQDECGNIYRLRSCDQDRCQEQGAHDRCPLAGCSAEHPFGRRRKLRTVWFYKGSCGVVVDPVIGRVELGKEVSAANDFDAAMLAARRRFSTGWGFGIIRCIADDLYRWQGLLAAAGKVNWPGLWRIVRAEAGCPPDPNSLKAAYEGNMKKELISIINEILDASGRP